MCRELLACLSWSEDCDVLRSTFPSTSITTRSGRFACHDSLTANSSECVASPSASSQVCFRMRRSESPGHERLTSVVSQQTVEQPMCLPLLMTVFLLSHSTADALEPIPDKLVVLTFDDA